MTTRALPPRSSARITMDGGESSPRTCSGVQSHGRSGVSKKQLWKSCISRGCSTQITQGTRRHSILTRSRIGTRMTSGSIEGCTFPCCGDKPEFVNSILRRQVSMRPRMRRQARARPSHRRLTARADSRLFSQLLIHPPAHGYQNLSIQVGLKIGKEHLRIRAIMILISMDLMVVIIIMIIIFITV